MKTLCFTLGLLLLTVCCCDAQTQALDATAPAVCCFNLSTARVPLKRVTKIIKTHSNCSNEAFIVTTVKGKQICYSQTFQWAVDTYNKKTSGQPR